MANQLLRGPKQTTDQRIEQLAARQHGVVSRAQLIDAGIGPHLVDGRVKRGRLHPIHRGVYRVGPLVSHRRRELGIHRIRGLRDEETTRLHGIPATTAPRTLLDLASSASPGTLERAVAEAFARGLTTEERLRRLVSGHPPARGGAALADLLDGGGPAFTRSQAEDRFLALVRDAQLPAPETNTTVAGYELDFFWPARKLVVEIDGRAVHHSLAAFHRDRRRDARLAASGLRVVRITWRHLVHEPFAVVARLAQTLGPPA